MIKHLPVLSIIGTASELRLGNHFLSSLPGFQKSMVKVSKTCLHSSVPTAERVFRCHLIIYLPFLFSCIPQRPEETPRRLFSLLFRAVPWALQNFRAGCKQTNKTPFLAKMCVIFDWDTCLFLFFWGVVACFFQVRSSDFFVCCAEG